MTRDASWTFDPSVLLGVAVLAALYISWGRPASRIRRPTYA
jgi:hypothetical protein